MPALGIGANTAIFTVIDSVLLDTLPVKGPQQLVFLANPENHGFSIGGWEARDRVICSPIPSFDIISATTTQVYLGFLPSTAPKWSHRSMWRHFETPFGRQCRCPCGVLAWSAGIIFPSLGVAPALGRTFTAEADKIRDANPVAVISYNYWRNQTWR